MPRPLAFIHLPRTGGSSISHMIEAATPRKKQRLKVKQYPTDFPLLASRIHKDTRFIYGHMNFGLHEYARVTYATILRDPIDRCVSRYQLSLLRAREAGRPPYTLEEFTPKEDYRNAACRTLAGVFGHCEEYSDSFLLDAAKKALRQIKIVGFFDDIPAFAKACRLPGPVPTINASADQHSLTPWELTMLKDLNRADTELHEWARARYAVPFWTRLWQSVSLGSAVPADRSTA